MRHRVGGRKFSRHSQHRKLMFRNMLVSLLQHERIKTTLAKGKELCGFADKMISLGKQGTLHARRQAFDLLRNREMVTKLFDVIAPKFKDREGGYTRLYKLGFRRGDDAPLSLVELLSYALPKEKKKSAVKKAKETLEKVVPSKKGKEEKKEKKAEEKAQKKEKEVKKAEKETKETPKKKKEKPEEKAPEKPKEKSKEKTKEKPKKKSSDKK